jgi:hypothetical protein
MCFRFSAVRVYLHSLSSVSDNRFIVMKMYANRAAPPPTLETLDQLEATILLKG